MTDGAADRYGTIAQLGEHSLDVRKVTGSSPADPIFVLWKGIIIDTNGLDTEKYSDNLGRLLSQEEISK